MQNHNSSQLPRLSNKVKKIRHKFHYSSILWKFSIDILKFQIYDSPNIHSKIKHNRQSVSVLEIK